MEFRLLGSVRAYADQRPVDLGLPKQRFVLAVLLLEANRLVAVDRLVELTWPQGAPPSARRIVHAHISRVRTVLRGAGVPDSDVSVVRRGSGYMLSVDPMRVDVHRFRALVGQAKNRDNDPEVVRLLRQALELWKGPPLADAAEDVRGGLCQDLEEAKLAAEEDLFDAELRLGRHLSVIGELTRLVAGHPLRQRLVGQQMLALYRAGRAGDALSAYRQAKKRLAGELGLDPDPALQRLELAILRGDQGIDTPGVTVSSPAVRIVPGQLPAGVAHFVGRASALDQLDTLLASHEREAARAVAIIAIDGMAGVGKTALAVHWAHQVSDRFRDGQLYVDLRGHAGTAPTRPIEALAALLPALGIEPERVPVELAEAASLYRSLLSTKRMLVVLDNAADARQIAPLLPGSPTCLVVVTSRNRLGGLVAMHGACHVSLDVFTPDEALALLAGIVQPDRVRPEPEAAAELARLCAHLPLALAIAAANLVNHPHQTIARYVTELAAGDRLSALKVAGDSRSAVRPTFDLSYTRLPLEARRMFRLLSLVPGPDVTAPAAACLAGTGVRQAEDLLDRLAYTHLLTEHAPGRFALHDLLRLYASDRARTAGGTEEIDAASRRLFDWYLHTAAGAVGLLCPNMLRLPLPPAGTGIPPPGFTDHAGALSWLDTEKPNLVAAATHGARHGPWSAAWQLSDVLRGYFHRRRHGVDWLIVATAGRTAAIAASNPLARVAAELSLADAHRCVGRYPGAIGHYTTALIGSRETGWPEAQIAILSGIGIVYSAWGELAQAADHYAQAMALARRFGIQPETVTLGNLGIVFRDMGRLAESAGLHARALATARQAGSRHEEATALDNIGEIYHDQGRLDQAIDHVSTALTIFREIGDRHGEALALGNLAAAHRDAGHHTQAVEHAHAALALARQTGDPRAEAEALNTLAATHLRLAQYPEATARFTEAERLSRGTGDRSPEICALLGLAVARSQTGNVDQAIATCHRAVSRARQAGHRTLESRALDTLAGILNANGRTDLAAEHAKQALTIHRETDDRLGEAFSLEILGAPDSPACAARPDITVPASVPCGHSYC